MANGTSAADNIGPGLLGRKPSPPDGRDLQLGDFIGADPLDILLAPLLASHTSRATKAWAQGITEYLKAQTPTPPLPPPAPPANEAVVWEDVEVVLDQGDTGHCVGFGSAQWGNTEPVDDKFVNSDGHAIYYECKVIDGEPGVEDGSYVRTAAKALQNRERLNAYAFAQTTDEITTFVRANGPVIAGTDWMNDMFTPDKDGFVKTTGGIAGGHCYLIVGHHPDLDAYECLNSWSDAWGKNGRFFIRVSDFAKLMQDDGEACCALELLLPG